MCRHVTIPLLVLCIAATACNQIDDHPDRRGNFLNKESLPTDKPVPPLNIPTPQEELPTDGDKELKEMSLKDLRAAIYQFAGEQRWELASRYQYWLCQKTKEKRYDLACYYARGGKNETALYWIQVAALEDGIDPDWADKDEDLTSVRFDGRWADMSPFLRSCAAYWAQNGRGRIRVVVPTNYKDAEPITTVVWLHKEAATPEDLVNEFRVRRLADEMNVAFVGVSGTHIRGRGLYAWSNDQALDYNRVKIAMKEAAGEFTVKPGAVVLVGFGQGASVAIEMAIRHPDEFAGTIAMSPSGDFRLEPVAPSELLTKRGFVITAGDLEFEGHIKLADDLTGWLHRAKAKVQRKRYPKQGRHIMPTDFDLRLPEWVRFVLQAG